MPGLTKPMETQMEEALFQVKNEQETPAAKTQSAPHTEPEKVEAEPIVAPKDQPSDELAEEPVHTEKPENARERSEREYHERAQGRIRKFEEQYKAANKTEEKPHVPQPVHPDIRKQTELEMEAGRKSNIAHAAQQANRPAPKISAAEQAAQGSSTPVFRPKDGRGSADDARKEKWK